MHTTAEVIAVDQLGGVLGVAVFGVELAHIVFRDDMNRRMVGAVRHIIEEERVGIGEAEVQRIVIDFLDGHQFAADGGAEGRVDRHIFIEHHVVPPEEIVVDGHGIAIGPFDTLAEVDG